VHSAPRPYEAYSCSTLRRGWEEHSYNPMTVAVKRIRRRTTTKKRENEGRPNVFQKECSAFVYCYQVLLVIER